MKLFLSLSLMLLLAIVHVGCNQKAASVESQKPAVFKIAFGSCGEQNKPQPILSLAADKKPDLFIFLGDNIYGDTYEMDTLRQKYVMLGSKPEFQKLKASTQLMATWDDHDYGWNDSGRHYPFKKESKQIFLDFFGVPVPEILEHDGIYHAKTLETGNKKIQVIMLDLRTFRDKLLPYNGNRKGVKGFEYELDYSPYTTADSTMLGEQQWKWLEAQLKTPADIRIIGSSSQFGITHNGYEAWANFPHEQKRLIDLIRSTKASGVLFISGDVHYAELSKLQANDMYPLYDLTASGITSTWDFATPNDNRIAGAVMENHFGMLTIDQRESDPSILMEIHDVTGKVRISNTIKLSELQFK
jgi:alkaline phosphatase D